MKTKRKTKNENLGKILIKSMKKNGTSKMFISKLIEITRPTLDLRLVDGEFNFTQIKKLQAKGFLPKDV
jgi:hypothetical protein